MTDKTEAQPEALRVRKYIARRSTSRGLDREHIHGFDVGDEAEALLLTSDLEAILGRIAFLEAQLSARQAVPDGWRLVPVEPTEEMIRAGNAKTWVLPCGYCWSAMLSAAPPPPEREPLTDDLIWAMEQLMKWQVKNVKKWHNHAYDNAHHVLEKFKAAHGIGATND